MSAPVREEDRQKNSSTSRGLGLAAAAIGVGVGAALYYFFSKQQDEENESGNHSRCNIEAQQAFKHIIMSSSEYSTLSEHSTSDTSVHNSSYEDSSSSTSYHSSFSSTQDSDTDSADESISGAETLSSVDVSQYTVNSSSSPLSDSSTSSVPVRMKSVAVVPAVDVTLATNSFTVETMMAPVAASNQGSFNVGSDTEMEWDVTNYSLDVPSEERRLSPLRRMVANVKSFLSPNKSRQRRWSLEECSICCEVMLSDQELKTLACSHHFHASCVRPWLEEHQTCPNCRKQA